MTKIREILSTWKNRSVVEGAGVQVMRAFAFSKCGHLDPFLLLDEIHTPESEKKGVGFPWHPHRGMETVTYVLQGGMRHEDSLGNTGEIGPGAVQWMTAGRGIIHQELPDPAAGSLRGFQLWINLPAADKMRQPAYQNIPAEAIPRLSLGGGVEVRVVSGTVKGVTGPVTPSGRSMTYLDVSVPPDRAFHQRFPIGHTVFAYVYSGKAYFDQARQRQVGPGYLVYYGQGDAIRIRTGDDPVRFLLVSGKPLKEPLAWNGPVVMNTQEELEKAFYEIESGTFVKS